MSWKLALAAKAARGFATPTTPAPKKATVSVRQTEVKLYILEERWWRGVYHRECTFTTAAGYLAAFERRYGKQKKVATGSTYAGWEITKPGPKRPDNSLVIPGTSSPSYNVKPVEGKVDGVTRLLKPWTTPNPVSRKADRTKSGPTPRRPSRAVPVLQGLAGPSTTTLRKQKEAARSTPTPVRPRVLKRQKREAQEAAGRKALIRFQVVSQQAEGCLDPETAKLAAWAGWMLEQEREAARKERDRRNEAVMNRFRSNGSAV